MHCTCCSRFRVAERCAEWGIFTEPRSWSSPTMERSRYETCPVFFILQPAFRNTGFCWFPPDADLDPDPDPYPDAHQEWKNDEISCAENLCCGSGSKIRDPVSFWPLDTGSGLGKKSRSGFGIRCHFDPWIRDPRWVKNQDPDAGSGSGMNIPDHISESAETTFWVENT